VGLISFETSQINPADLAAANARCYLALGRLDGDLAYAPPKVVPLFALMLVRRTLSRSLTAAGYLFTEETFTAWISRYGGPPSGGPGTAAPVQAIAATVLAEMRASKWPVLAEAADLVWRAAPHPGRGADGVDEEVAREEGQWVSSHEVAPLSIDAARALLLDAEESSAPLDAAPLSVLANRLGKVPALFAPIERATTVVETYVGPVPVPLVTQQSQGWALGLVVGAMFCELGVLCRPLSFAGTIVPEILRHDCDADVRLLRLATTIAQAAHDMLGDLETARRLVDRADNALADARTTSRAPAVFALIAGLCGATRIQFVDAFGMTAAGADGVLAKLLAAGLIARRPGRAGGFVWQRTPALRSATMPLRQRLRLRKAPSVISMQRSPILIDCCWGRKLRPWHTVRRGLSGP
jgi:hypothetical protein